MMKDIVYTRKYTDQKGQERKEYITVGYLFEKEGKTSILMKPYINVSALSNEKGEVWLGVYDHKTREKNENKAENKYENQPDKSVYKGAEQVKSMQEIVNPQAEGDIPF